MQLLQLSEATAAQRRLFFQAVDATDGITAETGLTGVGRISKNGAATAASSGSLAEIDSTNMPGRYYIELTAAELDTIGIIEFRYKAAACAEVIARGQVVPFDPYDAVRMGLTALPNAAAEAAGGLFTRGTGAGQINQEVNGYISVNLKAILGTVLTETAGQIAGGFKKLFDVAAPVFDLLSIKQTGDAYARLGAPAGASVSADVAAVKALLPTALVGGRMDASVGAMATDVITSGALAASAKDEIVDQVWDEAIAGHLGAGSTGLALNSAGSAGDPWSTAVPGAYGAGTAGNILGNNLNATVSSRSSHSAADIWAVATRTLTSFGTLAADVWAVATRVLTAGTNIVLAKGVGVTGFNDLSAAQVNAEVVDALNVDTYAEPGQATPAATASIVAKLGYVFKSWRNRTTQTAAAYNLYNDDAVTVDQKSTFSDDGTTAQRTEVVSGP